MSIYALCVSADHQCYDICGASPADMRLVEDMEALRESLGCADVQVVKLCLHVVTVLGRSENQKQSDAEKDSGSKGKIFTGKYRKSVRNKQTNPNTRELS